MFMTRAEDHRGPSDRVPCQGHCTPAAPGPVANSSVTARSDPTVLRTPTEDKGTAAAPLFIGNDGPAGKAVGL